MVIKQQIDLQNTQVYACGSNNMINSAKELFFKNNLKENNFFLMHLFKLINKL